MTSFCIAGAEHPSRSQIENLIGAVYSHQYGAHIFEYPKSLVASFDESGALKCAAGLRYGEFFSEIYLDMPIEDHLARATGHAIPRDHIIEVTCLAGERAGSSLELVGYIIRHSQALGYEWAFFTITRRLRTLLSRSGIPFLDIAAADRDRIARPESWGSYYRHDPRVTAVHVSWIASKHRCPDGAATARYA